MIEGRTHVGRTTPRTTMDIIEIGPMEETSETLARRAGAKPGAASHSGPGKSGMMGNQQRFNPEGSPSDLKTCYQLLLDASFIESLMTNPWDPMISTPSKAGFQITRWTSITGLAVPIRSKICQLL